jgi:hypothetical protein
MAVRLGYRRHEMDPDIHREHAGGTGDHRLKSN